MTDLAVFMPGADYAELAVYTSHVYCLVCGPVLREHLPGGAHVTYHRVDEGLHPHRTVHMSEEDIPVQ